MVRLGELIPDAARALGLEDELRLSRAIATFEAIVAERVPAAAGACRVIRLEGFALDVEADAPIVAQELRLRGTELLAAFAAAPGGSAHATFGSTSGGRSPRIIPRHLPATSEAIRPSPGLSSSRGDPGTDPRSHVTANPETRGSPDHERPGWPYGST